MKFLVFFIGAVLASDSHPMHYLTQLPSYNSACREFAQELSAAGVLFANSISKLLHHDVFPESATVRFPSIKVIVKSAETCSYSIEHNDTMVKYEKVGHDLYSIGAYLMSSNRWIEVRFNSTKVLPVNVQNDSNVFLR